MPIYTGRGDEGETDLHGGGRVSKTDPRIEAYGTVDELNALLGTIRPTEQPDINGHLGTIQHHLHIVQAELANPEGDGPRIDPAHVAKLEDWIDTADTEIEPLQSFILPGGGEAGAALHHARAVSRRAERRVIALAEVEDVEAPLLRYLNRLSDLLFTMARLANARDDEVEESPTY